MKRVLLVNIIIAVSIMSASAKPGGTYTLTGQEKSIEEIVKADMEKFPDLYNGETLRRYVVKFKQANDIGKRKLTPGDVLIFPDTRDSVEATRRLLVGKWKVEFEPDIKVVNWFKANGEHIQEILGGDIKVEGVWEIKGDTLRIKSGDIVLFGSKKGSSTTWAEHKIIHISEEELHTQLEGRDKVVKYVRVK